MGERIDKLLKWFDLRSEMEGYDTIHRGGAKLTAMVQTGHFLQ